MDESTQIPLKRCVYCSQEYPATPKFFNKNNQQRDGLTPRCKGCIRKGRKPREGYIDGKKRCRKCNGYFLPTPEFFNSCRTSADRLSPYCRECARRRSEANNRKIGRQPRKPKNPIPYHIRAREKVAQRAARWNKAHPENGRMRSKRYRQTTRGKMVRLVCEVRRRTRKINAKGGFTAQDIERMLKQQRSRCYYCGNKLKDEKRSYHVEHVVPLSRGGSNDPSNLVLACPTCNLKKGNKLPHEWAECGRLL